MKTNTQKMQLTNHHYYQQKKLTRYNVYSSGLDAGLDKPTVKDIMESIREI